MRECFKLFPAQRVVSRDLEGLGIYTGSKRIQLKVCEQAIHIFVILQCQNAHTIL